MKLVRFGVIGAGGIAEKRVIPALKDSHICKISAIMVRNIERAKEIAEKYNIEKYYDNVDVLINDKEIDAVYIATPVYLHKEQTIKSAKAGKHVLCEKPMALNVSECEKMIKACKDNKVKFMPAFMMRFHSSHKKIKQFIDEGVLGKIIEARAQLHLWYPEWDRPRIGTASNIPWRQDKKLGGGGSLMDVGCHCIDLLRFLIGEIIDVRAIIDTIAFKYPVEDTAIVLMRHENKAISIVDVSFAIPNRRENFLEIYGTNATILNKRTIGPFQNPEVRLLKDDKEEVISIPYINTYKSEFEHFAKCILENKEPEITEHDGLKNMEIISCVYGINDRFPYDGIHRL